MKNLRQDRQRQKHRIQSKAYIGGSTLFCLSAISFFVSAAQSRGVPLLSG
ncbi:MAG: hypothetical protein ACXW0L_09685 [Methylosarcina sp.]